HGQRQPALMAVETADVVVIGTGFAPAAGVGQLSFHTTPETQRGWDASDAAMKTVVEKDGLARHLLWKATPNVQSAHPLASCRMGRRPRHLGARRPARAARPLGPLRDRRLVRADLPLRQPL